MLVDLGRNDLGKICKNQTIHVSRYQDIVRFSTLMHLASTIQGELLESAHPLDALFATLPAGTLSGAPKFRACQIIQELEQSERGIYGGAFGYIDFSQNLDFCIGIRLAYKKRRPTLYSIGSRHRSRFRPRTRIPRMSHQSLVDPAIDPERSPL